MVEKSGGAITIPFVQTQVMTSRIGTTDLVLAGDLRGSGRTQLVTVERLEQ